MYLILGSTGYLGSHFLKYLRIIGETVRGLSRTEIDYTNSYELRSLLNEIKPRYLINAAGYTLSLIHI